MGVVKHNQAVSEQVWPEKEVEGRPELSRVRQIKNPKQQLPLELESHGWSHPCSLFSQGGVGVIIWGEFSVG